MNAAVSAYSLFYHIIESDMTSKRYFLKSPNRHKLSCMEHANMDSHLFILHGSKSLISISDA